MRSIIRERQEHVRLVGRAQGRGNADRFPRAFAGSSSVAGHEGSFRALPMDAASWKDMQNADGELYFVPGISVLGGPDILADL